MTAPQLQVRVIALGSPHGGDDELALELGQRLGRELGDRIELVSAGRPGAGLVDLLDTTDPVVLLDVVRSRAAPGTVHELDLAALPEASVAQDQVSSHGFGPSEALQLARVLGRRLPRGRFVGLEGACFEVGAEPSPEARASLEPFAAAARRAILELGLELGAEDQSQERPCTSPA